MDGEMIAPKLAPGEKLLWSGRPEPKVIFHFSDIIVIPFSLVFCGFAFFWEHAALRMYLGSHRPETFLFVLSGTIFILAGSFFLFGRFFFVFYAKKRTWYSLTDTRAIIITKIFKMNVKSIELKTAGRITKRVSGNGIGTISFGADKYRSGMQVSSYFDPLLGYNRVSYNNTMYTIMAPAFIDIENAENVYQKISGLGIKPHG
jgi:hypothetical protein